MSKGIQEKAGDLLKKRDLTIAFAESCTGGLLGHLLTNIPGSSNYFLGGIIAYSNAAKIKLLGVSPRTLAVKGAVSAETASEMAAGARRAFHADVALSITGIAGPGGGTREKPVGLVYIGLADRHTRFAGQYKFSGGRTCVKDRAARAALRLLMDFIAGKSGKRVKHREAK
ncbi:MAG: nicotinamide-nucleotide amidohydrolase family protein [Candidatus Aureabacteria bacterium]|nr:nicotinamide-nucleotide amidohydrolase family protein [Candidatus Auribacterota bacterium]